MDELKQAESLLWHLIARYNAVAPEPFTLEPEEKPPKRRGGVCLAIDGKTGTMLQVVDGGKDE